MSLPPLEELLPGAISLLLALPAGAPHSERWPLKLRAALRCGALLMLAVAALAAARGFVLPVPVACLAAAEAAFCGADAAAGLAFAPAVLAEAGWIVLFLRLGGGATILRLQPLRLAGVLSAVSGGVFIVRRFTRSLGAAAGPFALSTLALAAAAAMSLTLPQPRWPAIAGAFALLLGRGLLGAELARGSLLRGERGGFWLRYLGAAGITLAFSLPLAG